MLETLRRALAFGQYRLQFPVCSHHLASLFRVRYHQYTLYNYRIFFFFSYVSQLHSAREVYERYDRWFRRTATAVKAEKTQKRPKHLRQWRCLFPIGNSSSHHWQSYLALRTETHVLKTGVAAYLLRSVCALPNGQPTTFTILITSFQFKWNICKHSFFLKILMPENNEEKRWTHICLLYISKTKFL